MRALFRIPVGFLALLFYAVWGLVIGTLGIISLHLGNEVICQFLGQLLLIMKLPFAIIVGLIFIVSVLFEAKKTQKANSNANRYFVKETDVSNGIALRNANTQVVERLSNMSNAQIKQEQGTKPQNNRYNKQCFPHILIKRIIRRFRKGVNQNGTSPSRGVSCAGGIAVLEFSYYEEN